MATKSTSGGGKTTDSDGHALYLAVVESREHGYYHITASVRTQRYDDGAWRAWGVEDTYGDGLLWSGLRVAGQGDDRSQIGESGRNEPVYGYGVEYHDGYGGRMDLRRVTRMQKTLAGIERKLAKLEEARGRVRSYGEYLGRVAEVIGASGIAFERNARSRAVSGEQWEWLSVGEGVNRANHLIYLWTQEPVERERAAAGQRLQLGAGESAE